MKKSEQHFRIDTPQFFKEITDCALSIGNNGVLKIPLNIFMNLLGQVAQRCTQINDPILNKLMFDMTLYELPKPSEREYSKIMKKLYKEAEKEYKILNKK